MALSDVINPKCQKYITANKIKTWYQGHHQLSHHQLIFIRRNKITLEGLRKTLWRPTNDKFDSLDGLKSCKKPRARAFSHIARLNPGIFERTKWNLKLNILDCRASKIISTDTKPEP